MPRIAAAVLPALVLLAATACGGDDGSRDSAVSTPTAEKCVGYGCSGGRGAEFNEGKHEPIGVHVSSLADPGGNVVHFPNGLKVTIVSLETPDPEVFRQQEDGEQPLVLTTRWENPSSEPIEFADYDTVSAQLLSGPNGFEVDHYAVGGADTELPARLVPGSTFDYRVYYSVPDMSTLELRFSPDKRTYEVATFTEAEALLS